MAKLTNQEIKAVATKLRKLLEEKINLERLRVIHEYIPSPAYQKFDSLFKEHLHVLEQVRVLQKKSDSMMDEITSIFDKLNIEYRKYELYDNKNLEKYSDKIIEAEVKIPEVPSLEDLKNDITIAGIDEAFDVDSYIKGELDKFN